MRTRITVFKKEIRCIDISEQSTVDGIYEDITLTDDGYVISPKEYILVSLYEDIKLPEDISAHIRPKTKYTRLGLIVSDQHCNSTYSGKLSLGVFNATEYPIRIRKGYSIAQIVFEKLADVASPEKQYKNKKDAHYQGEKEFRGAQFDEKVNKVIEALFNG